MRAQALGGAQALRPYFALFSKENHLILDPIMIRAFGYEISPIESIA